VNQPEDVGLPFTVVGYYDDNGQVWVQHVTGFTYEDAVAVAVHQAKKAADEGVSVEIHDICIVEVFEGHHHGLSTHDHVVPACEWPGVKEKEEGN
jgi:hypothetical protein